MKKTLCILAAGLALSGAAQAERYTLHYTAAIDQITNASAPAQLLPSATANGNLISTGETVTGWFTFDTASQIVQQGDWSSGAFAQYGYDAATASAVQFGQSGYRQISTPNLSSIWVDDRRNPVYGLDGVSLMGPTILEDSGLTSNVYLYFQAPSVDAWTDTAIPVAALPALDGWFQYSYGYFNDNGEYQSLLFRGAMTSASVVSGVPEPGTYAMLLAGLGLLAWRRRAAA